MRVAVLGGTRFIGAAAVEELVAHAHDVLVMHRGGTERDDLPEVAHAHLDRRDTDALARALGEFEAEGLIDTCAYSRADAETAVAAIPAGVRTVVLSSQDVYRAFHTLRTGGEPVDALPLDEDAAVRTGDQRYLFRGEEPRPDLPDLDLGTYENLDVEAVHLAHGATVLRLPMVYGERDPVGREAFVLRRVLAGRDRIPLGPGTLLWSKGYVRDVAAAIRLAVETGAGAGRALNVAERRSMTMRQWARAILDAAGSDAELVTVPDDVLPEDLLLTGVFAQHLLVRSDRARDLLGWSDGESDDALRASVAWHLEHLEPADPATLEADDRALAAVV